MLKMKYYKPMINLSLINVFYITIICYAPLILKVYGQSYVDNFWLGSSANIASFILIYSTYLVLKLGVKKDKNNDKNLTILFVSIFFTFLVIYITVIIFSDNVVFVGGKYFSYAIYSYFIYTYLFLQFLIIFSLRFYHQLKKERL